MTNRDKLIMEAEKNNFFTDFMSYLKYLEKQPIKMTATGNISISSITALLDSFRQREVFKDYEKFGWKIRNEYEIEFLSQIKIIAEIMKATFKRKGKIKISKNGLGYLHNLDPLIQYLNMVLFYWDRVNWEYFCHSREIKGMSVVAILQKNRNIIWEVFSKHEPEWIDFKSFCNGLHNVFELGKFYPHKEYDEYSYRLDIKYSLFKKNLVRLGCVEIKEIKNKNGIKMISKFRVTPLGQFMFIKAQNSCV
ncbi:hypothetical protein KKA02_03725 [Patescibacteria group bacterium]|nr:hypothetical protein [Patescibacteria group bacterium]